eukprot:1347424-Amorphochlora_amoeboformis.AAC.2
MKPHFSRTFRVDKHIEACYTGGKVCIAEKDASRLFGWCNGDVAVSDLKTGRVLFTVTAGEDDNFTTFGVDSEGKVLVTAGQSQLLTSWELTDSGEEAWVWRARGLLYGVLSNYDCQ